MAKFLQGTPFEPPSYKMQTHWYYNDPGGLAKHKQEMRDYAKEHGHQITIDCYKTLCEQYGVPFGDVLPRLNSEKLHFELLCKLGNMGKSPEEIASRPFEELSDLEKIFVIKAFNKAGLPMVDLDESFWKKMYTGRTDDFSFEDTIRSYAYRQVKEFESAQTATFEDPITFSCYFNRDKTVLTPFGKKPVSEIKRFDWIKFENPIRNLARYPDRPDDGTNPPKLRDESDSGWVWVKNIEFDEHGYYVISSFESGYTNNEQMRMEGRECYGHKELSEEEKLRMAASGITNMEIRALIDYLYDIRCRMSYIDWEQSDLFHVQLDAIVNDPQALVKISDHIAQQIQNIHEKNFTDDQKISIAKSVARTVDEIYQEKRHEQKCEFALECVNIGNPVFVASDVNLKIGFISQELSVPLPPLSRITGMAYDLDRPKSPEQFDIKCSDVRSVQKCGNEFLIEFENFAICSMDISQEIQQVRENIQLTNEQEQEINEETQDHINRA